MPPRKFTTEELQNKAFEGLTLLKEVRKPDSKKIWWSCKCECGNIVERQERSLTEGLAESCGCRKRNRIPKGGLSRQWTGRGDMSGWYFSSIKCRSEKIGREFTITIDEAWELFEQQEGKCALTGLLLSFATNRQMRQNIAEQTASLDRIDSSKGYIPGNIQWVHKDVNLMKNHFPEKRFIEICNLVTAVKGNQFPTCT